MKLPSDKQKTLIFITCLIIPFGFVIWFCFAMIHDFYYLKQQTKDEAK